MRQSVAGAGVGNFNKRASLSIARELRICVACALDVSGSRRNNEPDREYRT